MKYIPNHERAHLEVFPKDLYISSGTISTIGDSCSCIEFPKESTNEVKLYFRISEYFKHTLPIRIKLNYQLDNLDGNVVFNAKCFLNSNNKTQEELCNFSKMIVADTTNKGKIAELYWREISIDNCEEIFNKDVFISVKLERMISHEMDTFTGKIYLVSMELFQDYVDNTPIPVYPFEGTEFEEQCNFEITGFESSTCNKYLAETEWEIIDKDTLEVVYSLVTSEHLETLSVTNTDLTENRYYKYRARFKDSLNNWSDWSEYKEFYLAKTVFSYDEIVLQNGVDLWWKFNETSGTTINDHSSNGWVGTYVGTIQLNQPSPFDNDLGVKVLPTSSSAFRSNAYFPVSTALSGEIIFSATTLGTYTYFVGGLMSGYYPQWEIHLYAGSFNITLYRAHGWSYGVSVSSSIAPYNDGFPHQIGFSWDRNDDKIVRIFYDGVLVGQSAPWDYNIYNNSAYRLHFHQLGNTAGATTFYEASFARKRWSDESFAEKYAVISGS